MMLAPTQLKQERTGRAVSVCCYSEESVAQGERLHLCAHCCPLSGGFVRGEAGYRVWSGCLTRLMLSVVDLLPRSQMRLALGNLAVIASDLALDNRYDHEASGLLGCAAPGRWATPGTAVLEPLLKPW